MHSIHHPNAIVIDNDCGETKVGFSGVHEPKEIFPTCVAHAKGHRKESNMSGEKSESMCGKQILRTASQHFELEYPMQAGIVKDWDAMEQLWEYTFDHMLKVKSEDHPVLLTEAPLNHKDCRARAAQIMFEKFDVPMFYITSQPLLAMYAKGVTTGLCLHSDYGPSNTYAVPVAYGYTEKDSVMVSEVGGRVLTNYLQHLLLENGLDLAHIPGGQRMDSATHGFVSPIARDAKRRHCYVAMDPNTEPVVEETYQLPDGHHFDLASERFWCPEALFQPDLCANFVNGHFPPIGVHDMIHQSIMATDVDLRHELFHNIVLSGGTTAFPGYRARLTKELQLLAPSYPVHVYDPDDRDHSVWIGGSMLAHTAMFQNMCITKAEFEENGPSFVEVKCDR